MLAILGGLGAALAWTATTLVASRASRLVDAWSLLATVMTVGLLVSAPVAAIAGVPSGLNRHSFGWLAVSGMANVAGRCGVLGFTSYAFGARHGLAVAAVLASQFAGIAAVASFFLFRERLTRVQVTGVVAIVCGVSVLSALHR